jgi:DNA-binding MarR family transcriptional regulator
MIRKSNYSKLGLLSLIGRRVQAFQDATDELDEAVAKRLGLNRTDLRCLSVLSQTADASASTLADAAGLSRGAMTTALDRLEKAGFVERIWDQNDRRMVRLEMTAAARKEVDVLYGPLARQGAERLEAYSRDALAAVLRYLEDGQALQHDHARRIRALDERTAGGMGRRRGRTKRSAPRGNRRSRAQAPEELLGWSSRANTQRRPGSLTK